MGNTRDRQSGQPKGFPLNRGAAPAAPKKARKKKATKKKAGKKKR